MKKEIKTNAMRLLDKHHISYEVESYETDGQFIDGKHTADVLGHDHACSFKTLLCVSKNKRYYVFVLPIDEELHLKEVARLTHEKSLELVHVRDLLSLTGYVRGGCSPIGMKKNYPVYMHQTALQYPFIYISGGKIGVTLKLKAEDLSKILDIHFERIIVE